MSKSIGPRPSVRVIWVWCVWVALGSSGMSQDEFLVTLRDGTRIKSAIDRSSLPWRRVDGSGSVTSEQLELDTVRSLELARLPASRQLVEVRKLLADIQSENYHVRNQAEAALVLRGGPFIEVLTAARESANAEVRYRVGRVLKQLQSKDAKRIDADFDWLTFNTGEVASGDLEVDSLPLSYRGKAFELRRETIMSIARASSPVRPGTVQALVTRAFSKPGDSFYGGGDAMITFDVGRLNESFAKFENIGQSYVFRGAVLQADCGDEAATIVTAGFTIDQARSRKNSAATMMRRENKKYVGAVQINFCQPGLANISATVHRVGCYIALVDHPRDFVLDAYNAEGDIVASVEALEKSAFIGLESAAPIAYMRVQPNRNLKLDPAEQDPNFVIDDLTFDPPSDAAYLPQAEQAVLSSVDGSRLVCSVIEFDGQNFIAHSKSPLVPGDADSAFAFAPHEVDSITFEPRDTTARRTTLWGSFADGASLPLFIDDGHMRSIDFDRWEIERGDLAGVFGGKSIVRYPLSEDLESRQTVVVLPAERWLVPEVQIGADGIHWDPSAAQLREVFHLENSSHAADATAAYSLGESPSIWWNAPVEPGPDIGWVRTLDGRKFTLNGASQIALEKLEPEAIVLSRGGQSIRIPWSEIVAVKFPTH